MYILETHIRHNIPIMLAGPVDTGKSMYLQKLLATKLPLDKYLPISVAISVNTTANFMQVKIVNKNVTDKIFL